VAIQFSVGDVLVIFENIYFMLKSQQQKNGMYYCTKKC